MAHVQYTGNIWRWNNDSIWFTLVRHAAEETIFHPVGIPLIFGERRIVRFGNFRHNKAKCGLEAANLTKLVELRGEFESRKELLIDKKTIENDKKQGLQFFQNKLKRNLI